MDICRASSEREIRDCFPVFHELRPHLTEEVFVAQIDRAFIGSAELEKFIMTPGDLINPFGTRNGHLFAWKQVQPLAFRKGVLG